MKRDFLSLILIFTVCLLSSIGFGCHNNEDSTQSSPNPNEPVTYTITSMSAHADSTNTKLYLLFEDENGPVDLQCSSLKDIDVKAIRLKQSFKINGWVLPFSADIEGHTIKNALCLKDVDLKKGDVLSLCAGTEFSYKLMTMTVPTTLYVKYNGDGTFTSSVADPTTECSATFFSDVHHSDTVFGQYDQWTTYGLKKLGKILEETKDANFYVDFGDFVQYLNNKSPALYTEAYNFMTDNIADGQRHYHLMGNHEAAYIHKSQLSDYIPYTEGIGSAYVFEESNMLFVAVDANYDSSNGLDTSLGNTTKFTIPQAQIDYLAEQVKLKMHDGINGIVWISHIAFTDIDKTQRWALVRELYEFGLPLTIFEGHTHTEAFDTFTNDDLTVGVYTLTSVNVDFALGMGSTEQKEQYVYYNVTFKDGMVESIEKIKGKITL